MGESTGGPERIRVGTARWSCPVWQGQVYPAKAGRGFDPFNLSGQVF